MERPSFLSPSAPGARKNVRARLAARMYLQRVDDAVKLAKKLDANSPAKRWATIMAKADAPSAPAAKSERLPPLAVAVAFVAAAYVVRALFAKE
jgi:hypothetical protein